MKVMRIVMKLVVKCLLADEMDLMAISLIEDLDEHLLKTIGNFCLVLLEIKHRLMSSAIQ